MYQKKGLEVFDRKTVVKTMKTKTTVQIIQVIKKSVIYYHYRIKH